MTSCGESERYVVGLCRPLHVCGHLPLKWIRCDQRRLYELFYANKVLIALERNHRYFLGTGYLETRTLAHYRCGSGNLPFLFYRKCRITSDNLGWKPKSSFSTSYRDYNLVWFDFLVLDEIDLVFLNRMPRYGRREESRSVKRQVED